MTEYDRTPIKVADMKWGDLIAAGNWSSDDPITFVGIDPQDPTNIVAMYPPTKFFGGSDRWSACGDWFKLTPKPEPVLCKHCGKEIIETSAECWAHRDTGRFYCSCYATPATESETA